MLTGNICQGQPYRLESQPETAVWPDKAEAAGFLAQQSTNVPDYAGGECGHLGLPCFCRRWHSACGDLLSFYVMLYPTH